MSILSVFVPVNCRSAFGRSVSSVVSIAVSIGLLLAMGGNLARADQAKPVQANPGEAKPHKHEARHEIDRLEEVWRDAVLKSDINALSVLLSDDYIAISSAGTLQTKDESLQNMRSRRMHFTSMDLSERKVRFYGNTALVTSLAQVQGTTPDGEVAGGFRYTHVYVRNPQGQWKIVSFEASRIRQPGERRKFNPGADSK